MAPGLFAGGSAALTRRLGYSPLLLGLGWTVVEFTLRPIGLSLGLLAADCTSSAVSSALANLLGFVLVAFAIAYVNATVFQVLAGPLVVGLTNGRSVPRASFLPRPMERSCRSRSRDIRNVIRPRAPPTPLLVCLTGEG